MKHKWNDKLIGLKDDTVWLIKHLIFKTPYIWQDAQSCGKKYCETCGGDWFNK